MLLVLAVTGINFNMPPVTKVLPVNVLAGFDKNPSAGARLRQVRFTRRTVVDDLRG